MNTAEEVITETPATQAVPPVCTGPECPCPEQEKPAQPKAEPFVIDSSQRFGPQRTIQLLGDAGVFTDDEARGAVLVAKRINHGLWGDFSKGDLSDALLEQARTMQGKYRALIASQPYAQLVESGQMQQLLQEYTQLLIQRSAEKLTRLKEGELRGEDELTPAGLNQLIAQEEKKLSELRGELNTYQSGGEYTKQMLLRVEKLAKLNKYLPTGKLVIESGLVNAEAGIATDMVNDVLGTVAARQVKLIAASLGSAGYVKKLAEKSGEPAQQVRLQALALAVRHATQPARALFEFEQESAELDRIVALKNLLSAQLHAAFSQPREAGQMAELEKQAQEVAAQVAQTCMSLAYHYLSNGPAKEDARIKKIQANLQAEMERDGMALLPEREAVAKAAQLARASAEDVLITAKDDAALARLVKALAKAAGATGELKPNSQLIGMEIDKSNIHYLLPASSHVEGLLQRVVKAAGLGLGALLLHVAADAQAASGVRGQLYAVDREYALHAFDNTQKTACAEGLTQRYGTAYRLKAELALSDRFSQAFYDTLYWEGESNLRRGMAFTAPVAGQGGAEAGTLVCYYALTDYRLRFQSAYLLPVEMRMAEIR